jgi:hypothetical protein
MSARIFCIFSLIGLPVLVCGQQSQITGPVSGYVFDKSAHGLRPVQGLPGASLLGDPIDFGLQVASVSVAPRLDAAFVTAADGTLHLFRIQSGAPADLNLNGLANSPERVSFSPSGTAAALYGRGSVQIVSGLPDSATIAASLTLPAAPDSLALSDDGTALMAASGNTVELFTGAADQGALTTTAGPALIAFAPSGHDAAVVDRTGAGVVLFHNLGLAVSSQNLAPIDDTIQSAAALAFSVDGQQLLVAGGSSVTTFNLAAGARGAIPCGCTPSTLARMGDLFRLNELSQEPLWLLDARPETAGVTFVPAAANSEAPVQRRPVRPERPVRGLTPAGQTGASPSRTQINRSE